MAVRYYEEAEKNLSSSIEANPGQVLAYEAMATLYDRQEKSEEEVTDLLHRAIKNGSTNPNVHLRYAQRFVSSLDIATVELAAETTASVMESLRFVMREAPELTDAARLFGFLALFSEAARKEGLQVVTGALERDPGNSSLLFMLGQLRAKEGAYAAARAIFGQLLDRELDDGFKASVRRQYDYVDAQIELEAQRRAEATSANDDHADEATDDIESAAATDEVRELALERSDGTKLVEVRGTLIRFDCNEGHRFIIEAEGLTYALAVVDLKGTSIFENGEHVGSREFYCGPLDERVIVRYIPAPSEQRNCRANGAIGFHPLHQTVVGTSEAICAP
jgi:tetratricopeptide (TPR) repeat protein